MSRTRVLPAPIIPSRVVATTTGDIKVGETTYKFPILDGGLGQVLTTNGVGNLTWQVAGALQSGLTPKDVFADYSIVTGDNFIRYRGTSPGTITLPQCSTRGGLQLIIQNRSTVPCTVVVYAGDTFDGDETPLVLDSRPASASLICDGLDTWLLI